MSDSGRDLRSEVLGLIRKKDNIEEEIKQLNQLLEQQKNVGMKESLVDDEGYPRNDIDVYQVRHARNRIICLQNDHKSIMKEIEEGLHVVHSQRKQTSQGDVEMTSTRDQPMDEETITRPIVKVESVSPGSPASNAGLLANDLIISFGSVSAENFKDLQNIAAVVQHSVNRSVKVQVERGGKMMRLYLTPCTWNGRGLLGCNIVPV